MKNWLEIYFLKNEILWEVLENLKFGAKFQDKWKYEGNLKKNLKKITNLKFTRKLQQEQKKNGRI